MPVDDIVDVRHGCVGAAWPVRVLHGMRTTGVRWRAARGIGLVDIENVFFDRVAFDVFEVSLVKIVAMVAVLDDGMAAVRAVRMDLRV